MQQFKLARGEVGDTGMLDLASLLQGDEGIGDLIGVHQGVRTVDQQQIQIVGAELVQRGVGTGDDMGLVGVVVVESVLRFGGEGDTALGDDLHPVTQGRLKTQGVAKGLLALVAAVDVGVIDSGNT